MNYEHWVRHECEHADCAWSATVYGKTRYASEAAERLYIEHLMAMHSHVDGAIPTALLVEVADG